MNNSSTLSPGTGIDLFAVDAIVAGIGTGAGHVIPILQAVQRQYHYLPRAALRRVCEITEITPAAITGVATFYSGFRLEPAGEHLIKVCTGTACHVKGAGRVREALFRFLRIADGADTDADRRFTVMEVACLGCCTLAPVVQIDDTTYGHLTPATVGDMIEDFLCMQQSRKHVGRGLPEIRDKPVGEIRVGLGSCCIAGGSSEVHAAMLAEIADLGANVRVKRVGCVGMCHRTPLVEVVDADGSVTTYAKVDPARAREIVRRHFSACGLVRKLRSGIDGVLDFMLEGHGRASVERYRLDVRDKPVSSFLDRQVRVATTGCGALDPLDLDEYLRNNGYSALRTVLADNDPERVVRMVVDSGLRGRGGAGFPTGRKWEIVRQQADADKVVIMNGDEGDPGAFMDRMLLESFPYRVLEGLAIAAFAVGAVRGELYIREEYGLALKRMREAIKRAAAMGFLGAGVCGSDFSLDLHIMEGAGAFVCGEETALIASIEGRRGTPGLRPPYPAQKGLWGRPTLINNVETYACVPWIMNHGARAFAGMGTASSSGTKVFSLTGKINHGGLIEVPMGMTIRGIVEEIGGGIQGGRAFKAVQIGGPSGGCIPASMADTPIDYEALVSAGAIMGSGGLVVLDETDCMVDVARYFLEFTQDQSCGKCTFCRIGTRRMLEILTALTEGRAGADDITKLERLARSIAAGSLCGLGRTAPNPVLSTLRYFRHEYEAHVAGRCPAGKCAALVRYFITTDCIGCTRCAQACPVDAIQSTAYQQHRIDDDKCTRCDMCRQACSVGAVRVRENIRNIRDVTRFSAF